MAESTAEQAEWVLRVLGITIGGEDATAPSSDARIDTPKVDGAGIRLAKGLMVWNQTRSHVAAQIAKLQQSIVATMQGDAEFDDIVASLGNLEEVLEHLDDRLTEKLGALQAESDHAAKAKLSADARKLVEEMQAYTDSDALMADIDDNGFVALDIKPRVKSALSAILTII